MHGACNNLSKNKLQGTFLMLLKVMYVQEKKNPVLGQMTANIYVVLVSS